MMLEGIFFRKSNIHTLKQQHLQIAQELTATAMVMQTGKTSLQLMMEKP